MPADARLIELSNLKINEATLTGESMPVDKHTEALGQGVHNSREKEHGLHGDDCQLWAGYSGGGENRHVNRAG